MFGRIGDILRGYGRRRKTDGVNNRGVGVRREIVWLPESDTDPNSRMENSAGATFSRVLTKTSFRRCVRFWKGIWLGWIALL